MVRASRFALRRLHFAVRLRTSYFVLRGSPPNFLPRCALRGSHFAVRTSRFVLRGSHFVVPVQTFFALRAGLHFRPPHPINNPRFLCTCAKRGRREGRELAPLATKLRISKPVSMERRCGQNYISQSPGLLQVILVGASS